MTKSRTKKTKKFSHIFTFRGRVEMPPELDYKPTVDLGFHPRVNDLCFMAGGAFVGLAPLLRFFTRMPYLRSCCSVASLLPALSRLGSALIGLTACWMALLSRFCISWIFKTVVYRICNRCMGTPLYFLFAYGSCFDCAQT